MDTRSGRRAKAALIPGSLLSGIAAAGRRYWLVLDPQLAAAGSEAGLVGVIARPSRADGADVACDGGAGVKSPLGLRGADVVWSVIVS